MSDADSSNNFDNRSDEETKRDRNRKYLDKAEKELTEEGKVGLWWKRNEISFFEEQLLIQDKAKELKEKDEYNRLKEKYR